MAVKFADRVVETTQTTGTGTLDLAGAADGYLAFSDELTDGDEIAYVIEDDPTDPSEWELGLGTFTAGSPNTLSRDTVYKSSNSGNKISLQSGTTYTVTAVLSRHQIGSYIRKNSNVLAKTADYTVVAADDGKLIKADGSGNDPAGLTITLPPEATAGDGFVLAVLNDGSSGAVTVNDDGGSEIVTRQSEGDSALLRCDGTAWYVVAEFLSTVSQTEAVAGTSTTPRAWTAERVKQAIQAQSALPRSYISGLGLSNNSTDSNKDIDIAAGECRDSTNAADLVLAAALTKQLDAAWAVGTSQGGLDTGTVAANTWYHVWLIKRSDTGVVDALFSSSASSPTMPTDYDYKRRVRGSILTDGSANIIAFKQRGDQFLWATAALDINTSSANSGSVLLSISVPSGIKVDAQIRARSQHNTSSHGFLLSSPDQADVAAGTSTGVSLTAGGSDPAAGQFSIRTNTSSQIRARADGSGVAYRIYTDGWVDRAGRDE